METQKYAERLAGVGAFAGLLYAMYQKSNLPKTALYMGLFGIGGLFLGNAIVKFKKD